MKCLQVIGRFSGFLIAHPLAKQKLNVTFFFPFVPANPKRARLFHDGTIVDKDIYEPFLRSALILQFSDTSYIFIYVKTNKQTVEFLFRLLWKGNWFIQEKSCKILALIVRYSYMMHFKSEIQITKESTKHSFLCGLHLKLLLTAFIFVIVFYFNTVPGQNPKMALLQMEKPQIQREKLLLLMMC